MSEDLSNYLCEIDDWKHEATKWKLKANKLYIENELLKGRVRDHLEHMYDLDTSTIVARLNEFCLNKCPLTESDECSPRVCGLCMFIDHFKEV